MVSASLVPRVFESSEDDGLSAFASGTTGHSLDCGAKAGELLFDAFVIAGLVARGTTEVLRVYHIDRGYER
ncbi:MAG: hypothetical protein AAF938_27895, partial [Myxococcota bacterium]